jgi:hypothetical protein
MANTAQDRQAYQDWLKTKSLTDTPVSRARYDAEAGGPKPSFAESLRGVLAKVQGATGDPGSKTMAPDPKTVKPIDLSEIDQLFAGTSQAPADLEKRVPELVQNRVTYGSANKDAFMRDLLASNEAVKNYSPEAQRNDPAGYQSTVKKNEILNAAANKLRYELPNPMTYNIRKDFANAINPEFNPAPAKSEPVVPSEPADQGATPPPRPASQTGEGVAGPLPPDVKVSKKEVQKAGFDWDKVKQVAADTGLGILGVIQAAIAGRTAGLQGRNLDFANDTIIGRGEAKKAVEDARIADLDQQQIGMDWQMQLKQIDQDFSSGQAQLAREFDVAMSQAKTDEDRARMQAEFAQRDKEQRAAAAQRMAEIAASNKTAPGVGGIAGVPRDSLGIMGIAK